MRRREHGCLFALLNHATIFHHDNLIRNGTHCCEVMGDKHVGQLEFVLQFGQQPQDGTKTHDERDEIMGGLVYEDDEIMLEVREIVQEIRKLCSFLKNSTKCFEALKKLQKKLNETERTFKIQMDVRTRWNSTLSMVERVLKLMKPINQFLSHYNSAAGKREFKGNKTKLSIISDQKWAILQGLSYILTPFARATTKLSGEKYPTFVSALPVLRYIKKHLSSNMFMFADVSLLSKRQKEFYSSLFR